VIASIAARSIDNDFFAIELLVLAVSLLFIVLSDVSLFMFHSIFFLVNILCNAKKAKLSYQAKLSIESLFKKHCKIYSLTHHKPTHSCSFTR